MKHLRRNFLGMLGGTAALVVTPFRMPAVTQPDQQPAAPSPIYVPTKQFWDYLQVSHPGILARWLWTEMQCYDIRHFDVQQGGKRFALSVPLHADDYWRKGQAIPGNFDRQCDHDLLCLVFPGTPDIFTPGPLRNRRDIQFEMGDTFYINPHAFDATQKSEITAVTVHAWEAYMVTLQAADGRTFVYDKEELRTWL